MKIVDKAPTPCYRDATTTSSEQTTERVKSMPESLNSFNDGVPSP